MAGYTRQATANIVTGGVIDAADINDEYNQVESAFNATTGHNHDGTTGEGAPIESIGPSQDVVATATVLRPKTTDTVSLGTSSLKFKDAFFSGSVTMAGGLTGDSRNPANNVDVQLGNQHDYIHFDADVGMRFYTAGEEDMRLEDDGDLHVDGNVVAFSTTISDERLKHNIEKIDGALDKVSQINGYTFSYNKDGKKSAGVIAQELEKVLPSAVENKSLVFHEEGDIEYKTVHYDQLHGLLIEAIKELKAEIEDLKNGSPS